MKLIEDQFLESVFLEFIKLHVSLITISRRFFKLLVSGE